MLIDKLSFRELIIINEILVNGKTMAALGKEFDVSVPRIREVFHKGLRKTIGQQLEANQEWVKKQANIYYKQNDRLAGGK